MRIRVFPYLDGGRAAAKRPRQMSGIIAADAAHFVAQIVALQREGHVRLEKSFLAAAIEASAFEAEAVERPVLHPHRERVGELDFAAGIFLSTTCA